MGSVNIVPPSGAFLQATKTGEAELIKNVLEIIGTSKKVVDLFSGCGTFTLPISSKASVYAVEGDRNMVYMILSQKLEIFLEGHLCQMNLKKLMQL